MTTRSMYKTTFISVAMLLASLGTLAAGGSAQAGISMHSFHHYNSPIARIPTGPNKPLPYHCRGHFCPPPPPGTLGH